MFMLVYKSLDKFIIEWASKIKISMFCLLMALMAKIKNRIKIFKKIKNIYFLLVYSFIVKHMDQIGAKD